MQHAKPRKKSKVPAIVAGLALLGVTGLCVGGLLSNPSEKPKATQSQTESPGPGSSDEAPKEPTQGQEKAAGNPGPTTTESSSQGSTANTGGKSPATASTGKPDTGKSPSPAGSTPAPVVTITPKPSPSVPTKKPDPVTPVPPKPVYQFFIADDSKQNRTWCDTRPSGSVRVQIGTEYQSYYNDQDPVKAFNSWRVSNETETCP